MIDQLIATAILIAFTIAAVTWGAWDEAKHPDSWQTSWTWEVGDGERD